MPLREEDVKRKKTRRLENIINNPEGWDKYLKGINISGIRHFDNLYISFNFPVTALCGANGSGKSTILACAVSAFENEEKKERYYLSNFFKKTRWDDISGVEITYRFFHGGDINKYSFKYKKEKWRATGGRIRGNTKYFGLSRLVPVSEVRWFARFEIKSKEITKEESLDDKTREVVCRVLGKKYVNLTEAYLEEKKERGVGIAETEEATYSSFHMGAGESVIVSLIKTVLSLPNNSLVIIEEIENALHPEAQERLVEFLIDEANERQIQSIISTHSPYVLGALPDTGRWLLRLNEKKLVEPVNKISVEYALSKISKKPITELTVYVEDVLARDWLTEIFYIINPEIRGRVDIVPVGPADSVINFVKTHEINPNLGAALGILDGDSEESKPGDQKELMTTKFIKLPGEQPERTLFNRTDIDYEERLKTRISVELKRPEGKVELAFREINALVDPHDWIPCLSASLNVNKENVRALLVHCWLDDFWGNEASVDFVRALEKTSVIFQNAGI